MLSPKKDPLPKSSMDKLKGVDPDLVNLVLRVAEKHPGTFIVTEGMRSKTRQKELYAQKKTKTMNSLHLIGRAVDIAVFHNGAISWERKHFTPVVNWFKDEAHHLKMHARITFGHDWGWDSPHIQIAGPA